MPSLLQVRHALTSPSIRIILCLLGRLAFRRPSTPLYIPLLLKPPITPPIISRWFAHRSSRVLPHTLHQQQPTSKRYPRRKMGNRSTQEPPQRARQIRRPAAQRACKVAAGACRRGSQGWHDHHERRGAQSGMGRRQAWGREAGQWRAEIQGHTFGLQGPTGSV